MMLAARAGVRVNSVGTDQTGGLGVRIKPGRVRPPVFTSLHGYKPEWLRGDAIAGLTVWAVLVPEALAYASIAGVSPVVGLYAAPGALIFYAAFGSSSHLVVGPMAAAAALSAAAVGQVAAGKSGAFAAGVRRTVVTPST